MATPMEEAAGLNVRVSVFVCACVCIQIRFESLSYSPTSFRRIIKCHHIL